MSHLRECLAEDNRTNELDVQIEQAGNPDPAARGGHGPGPARGGGTDRAGVLSRRRHREPAAGAERPGAFRKRNNCHDPHRRRRATCITIASRATGFVRASRTLAGGRADLFLIAGDLTQHGTVEEAEALADDLEGLPLPIITVLGNHDFHSGQDEAIERLLQGAGSDRAQKEKPLNSGSGNRQSGPRGAQGLWRGICRRLRDRVRRARDEGVCPLFAACRPRSSAQGPRVAGHGFTALRSCISRRSRELCWAKSGRSILFSAATCWARHDPTPGCA